MVKELLLTAPAESAEFARFLFVEARGLSYSLTGLAVNSTLLLSLALLGAHPAGPAQHTIYRSGDGFSRTVTDDDLPPLVIRAQDSPFYDGGGTPPTYAPPGGSSPQVPPTTSAPFDPFAGGGVSPYGTPTFGAPMTGDPFAGGGGTVAPYGYNPFAQPAQPSYTFGLNGPQPFRYGWQAYYDLSWMPSQGTSSPNVGDLSIFEADFAKELVTPIGRGYTFTIAPQFNYRSWDGPLGVAGGNAGLPANAYRFGLGLKLATPTYGAWQFEAGIDPAIGTDLNSGISSDAFMLDAHAVLFYRTSPQWMFAIGAAYWDRVDDLILPYAGVVWTPNDYLEFRLLFPKPRISWFVGTPLGVPTWLYAAGEYHVEAFEVSVDPINRNSRVQFEDWRLLGGARAEFGSITAFLEAGWVFNRDVTFDAGFGTDFSINDGFIARAGFRY